MPTILRHAGFEVRIYTADHPPPHVHVHKGGAVLKVPLATCLADQVVGEISDRDVRRAEEFVADQLHGCGTNGSGFMAKRYVGPADRERIALARAAGDRRRADPSAVVGAKYDHRTDTLLLAFRGGGSVIIPRRLLWELEHATAREAAAIVVSPAGDAISWPRLDVDVYVPGLMERAFGNRLLAAATGRKGGLRRSKAKTAAARLNGALGGRPRREG